MGRLKSGGYDAEDPNEMMNITIDSYKPGFFGSGKDWLDYSVLKGSEPENDRTPTRRFKSFEDQQKERKQKKDKF